MLKPGKVRARLGTGPCMPQGRPNPRVLNDQVCTKPEARINKSAILRKLLSRKSGADLSTLQAATGWQAHSVRAALSGFRKQGVKIVRTSPSSGGPSTYRITAGTKTEV